MAFTADNEIDHINLLKEKNIDYIVREVPEIGTRQIFFKDPAGNGIELIFSNDN